MSSAVEMLQSSGDGDSSPHYKYRLGDSYDNTTDKLLLNTKINHGEKIIVSDRTKDDYTEFRPHKRNIDIVNARFRHCDAIYKHPILPGYEGFVPRVHGKFGQRFTVLATEALSEMEEEQMKDRLAVLQTTRQTRIQDNSYSPTNAEDRQLIQSEFKLPLLEVRPQAVGVLRNLPVDEPIAGPMHPGHNTSPYFKDCLDPEKRFMTGYAGHIPYGYSRYGETFETYSRSALCDFTSNYKRRQSAEWAPVAATRPDPPLLIQPTEIYPKHIGMLPRYEGHIPGSSFRCGKTFGNDTRDAKCWLRGDYKT